MDDEQGHKTDLDNRNEDWDGNQLVRVAIERLRPGEQEQVAGEMDRQEQG
jgi:hypothetical protein